MADKDDAKRIILARRARFLAAALASVAATASGVVGAQGCGGDETEPGDAGNHEASVSPPSDTDGAPQTCLSAPPPDAGDDAAPQPCLDIALEDAGDDADAEPQPCLAPPP